MTICLCSGLAGCDGTSNQTVSRLKLETPRTVIVWYTDEKYTEYLNYVAEQVHQENELITIELQLMDSENYLENIYNSSVKENGGPDLYIMSANQLEKANMMGLMLKNNSYEKYYAEKNYSKAALEAAAFNNELYGYPFTFNVPFMVYNKDVAPEVSTFGELYEYAVNYKVNDNNKNIKQIINWDVSDMFINYTFSCNSIDIGGETGDDLSSLRVDKVQLKKAMQQFVKQKENFGIERGTDILADASEKFADETMAYTITDVNHLKEIDASSVNYAVMKVPKLIDDLENSLMSENVDVFVSPYASDIEVAKAVAHCLSYDYAEAMFEKTGLLCARNIGADSKSSDGDNRLGMIYQLFQDSQCQAQFMGQTYYYARYEIMLHQVWDGGDIEAAVDAFAADFTEKK